MQSSTLWLFAVLVGVPLGACGRESATPSAPAEAFVLPADQVANDVTWIMTNNGVRTATLRSDTAYVHEIVRRFDLVGVRVSFYGEGGAEAGTLTSRTGDYDMENGLFIARGEVVLVTEGPEGERRLETEELRYHLRDDLIATDQPFTLTEAGRTTQGTSFSSDARFQVWETRGIRTEGDVSREGGITF